MGRTKTIPRCGWCGWEGKSWLEVDEHGHSCPKNGEMRAKLVSIAELLEHTAGILRGKVIVMGEEPLEGAREKCERACDELAEVIGIRDRNLKGIKAP